MDEDARTVKRGKLGAGKYVYPRQATAELRDFFEQRIAAVLPRARMLY